MLFIVLSTATQNLYAYYIHRFIELVYNEIYNFPVAIKRNLLIGNFGNYLKRRS